jgi:hypothetical protein
VAVVLLSDAVAVIITIPAAMPVTRPEDDTIAIDVFPDFQVTAWLALDGPTVAVS